MRRNAVLALAFVILSVSPSWAVYKAAVKARYQVQYGLSQWYDVDVTFATGFELNQATVSFDYEPYSRYAVIFWGKSATGSTEASVIKLGFGVCGMEFEQSCISILNEKGQDQEGRNWEICTNVICY